jgi:hypothetical protein
LVSSFALAISTALDSRVLRAASRLALAWAAAAWAALRLAWAAAKAFCARVSSSPDTEPECSAWRRSGRWGALEVGFGAGSWAAARRSSASRAVTCAARLPSVAT